MGGVRSPVRSCLATTNTKTSMTKKESKSTVQLEGRAVHSERHKSEHEIR